eukprot:scaffold3660_cov190-Alexandrium_tamarense.AAC.1
MRCRWSAIAFRSMKRRSCLVHMCIHIVVHCQLVVSFFIHHRLLAFLVPGSIALLQWRNDQSPSTKSPSQAPTASPITPDPTKASNVTIPCGMIQRGSSYPRRLWTLVSSYFSCIF